MRFVGIFTLLWTSLSIVLVACSAEYTHPRSSENISVNNSYEYGAVSALEHSDVNIQPESESKSVNALEPRESKTKKQADKEIVDIEQWDHPVKQSFLDHPYSLTLHKVELYDGLTYPIFYVTFTSDLEYEDKTIIERIVEDAAWNNGYWNFTILDVERDLKIEVICDREEKIVERIVINGDDDYFEHLYREQNKETIEQITRMKREQHEILAEDDIDLDGLQEFVVKYSDKIYLLKEDYDGLDFIGELIDHIIVVHDVEDAEIVPLDNSGKKYIVTHVHQALNGGTGFAIFDYNHDEVELVNANFYGATAKGQSTLEDIDQDGVLDSVLRVYFHDSQQHVLAYYTKWDGTGERKIAIEYWNDTGAFVYPDNPESVIQNYIEAYYQKDIYTSEIEQLTANGEIEIPDFYEHIEPGLLEYYELDIDYELLSDAADEKVYAITPNHSERTVYRVTVRRHEDRWVVDNIELESI